MLLTGCGGGGVLSNGQGGNCRTSAGIGSLAGLGLGALFVAGRDDVSTTGRVAIIAGTTLGGGALGIVQCRVVARRQADFRRRLAAMEDDLARERAAVEVELASQRRELQAEYDRSRGAERAEYEEQIAMLEADQSEVSGAIASSRVADDGSVPGGGIVSADRVYGADLPPRAGSDIETRVFLYEVDLAPSLTFQTNSAVLRPAARRAIDALVIGLNDDERSSMAVGVVGHTDTVGPADANQRLSERRARAVAAYIRQAGLRPPERLQDRNVIGKGESSPVVMPEVTAADRAANRRVQIVLIAT